MDNLVDSITSNSELVENGANLKNSNHNASNKNKSKNKDSSNKDSSNKDLKNNTKEQKLSEKQIKKNLTSYWGISLTDDTRNNILNNCQIKQILDNNVGLIPLLKIHSTLLYVGKKVNEDEAKFLPFENKECVLVISEFGYSDDSIALKVDSLNLSSDNTIIPSFSETQHITLALRQTIMAKDSVKSINGENSNAVKIVLDEKIIVRGNVKRFLF